MPFEERIFGNLGRPSRAELPDTYVDALVKVAWEEMYVNLPEIGVRVSLHSREPLRLSRRSIEARDLQVSVENGKDRYGRGLDFAIRTYADQLAIQRSKDPIDPLNRGCYYAKDYLEKRKYWLPIPSMKEKWLAGNLFKKQYGAQAVDFSIAQCFIATMDWGVNFGVDNRIFGANGVRLYYKPSKEDLGIGRYYEQDDAPAGLVGNALVEYREGCKRYVFCRQMTKGIYAGRWAIPGGKYDRLDEVAGLAEMKEEMGDFGMFFTDYACPLCIADQRIFVMSNDDKPVPIPRRFVSYVWQVPMGRYYNVYPGDEQKTLDRWPQDGDGEGEWCLLGEDELYKAAQKNELTPAMQCALTAAGYIDYRVCPNVFYKPSPLLKAKQYYSYNYDF